MPRLTSAMPVSWAPMPCCSSSPRSTTASWPRWRRWPGSSAWTRWWRSTTKTSWRGPWRSGRPWSGSTNATWRPSRSTGNEQSGWPLASPTTWWPSPSPGCATARDARGPGRRRLRRRPGGRDPRPGRGPRGRGGSSRRPLGRIAGWLGRRYRVIGRDAPLTMRTSGEIMVKICGITSEADALLAVGLGADAVGFVLAPSPRQLAPGAVADIVKRLPPRHHRGRRVPRRGPAASGGHRQPHRPGRDPAARSRDSVAEPLDPRAGALDDQGVRRRRSGHRPLRGVRSRLPADRRRQPGLRCRSSTGDWPRAWSTPPASSSRGVSTRPTSGRPSPTFTPTASTCRPASRAAWDPKTPNWWAPSSPRRAPRPRPSRGPGAGPTDDPDDDGDRAFDERPYDWMEG